MAQVGYAYRILVIKCCRGNNYQTVVWIRWWY